MKVIFSGILTIFFGAFACQAQTTESDGVILSSRGLVKKLYTLPHRQDPTRYRTWVSLKGTGERAACRSTVISEFDEHSLEILKLAAILNKPVIVQFNISKDTTMLEHCEIYSVELQL